MVDAAGYEWFFVMASMMGIPAIILSVVLLFHDKKRQPEKNQVLDV
jgi:hypothetical protein